MLSMIDVLESVAVSFDDAPEMKQVEAVINGWQKPEPPDRLKHLALTSGESTIIELACLVREGLAELQSLRYKVRLEVGLIGWLYDFIRANVKRGRVFDLRYVLLESGADCLGYAKLFTLLGRLFGLDVGIIEVVVDNAGRYVPHTAVLVKLSNGQLRFVDLWYGSKNIRHKRMGLWVKRGKDWKIEDLELSKLGGQEEVSYLPDSCVDAITLYIRGNRYLGRRDFDGAIRSYTEALRLYPGNARSLYNRAVAYENLGYHQKAESDYAQALRDDDAVIRVLATEHDEVVGLIELDAKGIDELAQDIYLHYQGFATGRRVPLPSIGRRFGLSEAETGAILSSVKARLAISLE